MKKIIGFLSVVVFLTNCNNNGMNKGAWSKQDEDKWMNVCLKGSTENQMKNICSCVLQKLEKKYANYQDLDMHGTAEEGRELGQECSNGMNGNGGNTNNNNNNTNNNNGNNNNGNNNNNNNEGGGWTNAQRQEFMQGCVPSAQQNQGLNSQDANSYCECMQKKIEQKFPSYNDANKMTNADFQTQEWQQAAADCKPHN